MIEILAPVAVVAILVIAVVLVIQRGGLDISPRGLLLAYLYLASLVSVLVLVFGLTQTLTGVMAVTGSADFVYGRQPGAVLRPAPPSPEPVRPPTPTPEEQNDRRTRESLLQGITSAAAGLFFWAIHWYARRQLETEADRGGVFSRAYYLAGVVIFGIAAIIGVPLAVYGVLRWFLIPVGPTEFRQGAGGGLAFAIVVLPTWLIYLWIVTRELRRQRAPEVAA